MLRVASIKLIDEPVRYKKSGKSPEIIISPLVGDRIFQA